MSFLRGKFVVIFGVLAHVHTHTLMLLQAAAHVLFEKVMASETNYRGAWLKVETAKVEEEEKAADEGDEEGAGSGPDADDEEKEGGAEEGAAEEGAE